MSGKQQPSPLTVSPTKYLLEEYEQQRRLYEAQPTILKRYFDSQAQSLGEIILQHSSRAKFILPDKVVVNHQSGETGAIPAAQRDQMAGGLKNRITGADLAIILRARFKELEQSNNTAIAAAAGVLRFATCHYMVSSRLPSGRTVQYLTGEGETIPSTPVAEKTQKGSAITATTDAIAEEGGAEENRGELQVPYVAYARRFFLPKWVAFDEDGDILAKSVAEAEAHVASMQQYLTVLHTSVGLAAYFIVDAEYQRKRYGMLGQLVNQGRALALYQTKDIIQVIKRRAHAGELNRGLSITLPYFDDQSLKMKVYPFEIIPAGRILFVPAFVVRAVREEAVKVAQDTRLSPSTRNHILTELCTLEEAFLPAKV